MGIIKFRIASDLRLKIPQLKKAESTVAAAEANLEKLKGI